MKKNPRTNDSVVNMVAAIAAVLQMSTRPKIIKI